MGKQMQIETFWGNSASPPYTVPATMLSIPSANNQLNGSIFHNHVCPRSSIHEVSMSLLRMASSLMLLPTSHGMSEGMTALL
jgi:hypothetical protein